jgi:F0F1-type ATP synthase assembly protein I
MWTSGNQNLNKPSSRLSVAMAVGDVMALDSRNAGGRELFKYAGLGFEFAGVVGLGFYFGYLADSRWGIAPWGLLTGGGVGLTGGIYHLAKQGNKMMRSLDSDSQTSRDKADKTGRSG